MDSDQFIGLMSGTSMDGIDAALCEFADQHCRVLASHHHPYPEALQTRLRAAAEAPQTVDLRSFGALNAQTGQEFAAAALAVMKISGSAPGQVTAIGSHGQTLLHAADAPAPFTIQVGDPALIAVLTGLTVVADFRSTDLALGGQGAPLAPAFHNWVFRANEERVILNLGGIANITRLAPGVAVTGFDTGPASTLLDAWCRRHRGQAFDRNGEWAASGTANIPLLSRMLSDPWFERSPPKSTGVDYFCLDWLQRQLRDDFADLAAADIQATLAELTAESVAAAISAHTQAQRVAVCGGGIHNVDLMARLRRALPDCSITSTAVWGVDPDWVEAAAFAWLARERLAGRTGNQPSVTGARRAAPLGGVFLPKAL